MVWPSLPPARVRAALVSATAVFAVALGVGCTDPCVVLAERICNCESTASGRRSCIADRITNQQGRVETSEADQAFCTDKLETCDCQAIDENNLEACGFVEENG